MLMTALSEFQGQMSTSNMIDQHFKLEFSRWIITQKYELQYKWIYSQILLLHTCFCWYKLLLRYSNGRSSVLLETFTVEDFEASV